MPQADPSAVTSPAVAEPRSADGRPAHVMTVNVEEYFHVGAFEDSVQRKHWTRFESRLEPNVDRVLELFQRHGVTATFFVLGWIAERYPEVVARISDAGHEVASRGYWPGRKRGLMPEEFIEELTRSRAALEAAGSNPVIGYRASRWLREEDLWMLDVLAEEGFRYDSSINPILRRFSHDRRRFEVHRHRATGTGHTIWEFPISTVGLGGLRVPIAGGNWARQFPHDAVKRAVAWWDQSKEAPLVYYFMTWELDADEPRIQSVSLLNRIRHYRNLGKMQWVLDDYFRRYRFQSIAEYLGVPVRKATERPRTLREPVEVQSRPRRPAPARDLEPVTLVVPLYNEELNVAYLHRTLLEFRDHLARSYRIYLSLVDDGSTDGTWDALHEVFGGTPDCNLIRHQRNMGVAAAILTGIQEAPTEIVCSIDCDCTYDPNELERMIPLIEDADLVTASPYHPEGSVFNVPEWRLFLSKSLSKMYCHLLDAQLHTYTSCCRVYRKSVVQELELRHGDFLGIAELLIEVLLSGGRVVEYPATLEARLFGESKMKLFRTIRGHVGILRELYERQRGEGAPAASAGAH